MKKTILFLYLILLTAQLVMSQNTDSIVNNTPQSRHDMYLEKSKSNKAVGWLLLGAGIGITAASAGSNLSEGLISNNPDKGKGLAIFGAITTIASIPFFISGSSNKRKAKLALKGESVMIGKRVLTDYRYTSLSLLLPLTFRGSRPKTNGID